MIAVTFPLQQSLEIHEENGYTDFIGQGREEHEQHPDQIGRSIPFLVAGGQQKVPPEPDQGGGPCQRGNAALLLDAGAGHGEYEGNQPLGSHFYEQISRDLQEELPDIKSFSLRNLLYMHQFYRLFSGIAPQAGAQSAESGITPQVDAQLNDNQVFCLPWGHLKLLIDKCGDNLQKALFYVRITIENNWSRAELLNQLDMDLIK